MGAETWNILARKGPLGSCMLPLFCVGWWVGGGLVVAWQQHERTSILARDTLADISSKRSMHTKPAHSLRLKMAGGIAEGCCD